MRKSFALLAAGTVAGVTLWRQRNERRRPRVDLYFADGSMASFTEDSEVAAAILQPARDALAAAGR